MIDIDTSSPREQRNFGIVLAVALGVFGLYHRWRGGEDASALVYSLWGLGIAFIALGFIVPGVLRPLLVVWIRLALVLNFIVTHVVLTFAFCFTVVPIGLALKILKNDPLKRALDRDATSYWEDVVHSPEEVDGHTKQF